MKKTLATNEMITALRRRRGEENITITKMANEVGVSSRTLYPIINGHRTNIRPSTAAKLNAWLYTKI